MDVTTSTVSLDVSNDTFELHNANVQTVKKEQWTNGILFASSILMAVGLTGNILSIFVWRRKAMRSSTSIYLIAQAVADTGLLLFYFCTHCLVTIKPEVKKYYPYGVFYSYIGYPFFFLFAILATWITVGVTVDRYIHVCWVLQARKLAGSKQALIGVGLITTLCSIVNGPQFVIFRPVSNTDRNVSCSAFVHTEFGAGKASTDYKFWAHCMFLVIVPWITIFCLNMLIIQRVSKMNKDMEDKRDEKFNEMATRSETQLTKLLLTVTFTYLLLTVLDCVSQCFFMLQPPWVDIDIVTESYAFGKLGVVLNSSINFFLYCLSGRRFRKELRQMFTERCACRPEPTPGTDSIAKTRTMFTSAYSPSPKLKLRLG